MITQEILHQLFAYDPETGLFIRKIKTSNNAKMGIAGTNNGIGYITICVNSKLQYAHRLAWMYMYGSFPDGNIDHINGNPSDNRICNLRLVNQSQNMQNIKKFKNNTSGYKGVTWRKDTKKWTAQIWKNSKRYGLGCFDSAEDAYEAYCQAAKTMHTHNRVIDYVQGR
jgi:hypothetical protein